ncbi:rhomboid protease GluP [Spiroplasma gladiatoris]|uniref:Rhomboid protease GluP n=1 Tax=Spiroplasma gladiatoris TaxID=2143 RepID=A0A4P7AJF1_9MOLU|nr:rhomboid family intramembrane serine protease [Spiroplasma gladiatoris]QBQ07928.1 rhomboid protease GluP [Spiroplasma gladiatoris]
MANNDNDLKLTLVHYLVKVEKYKADASISDDFNVYLYNKKADLKVIVITIGEALENDQKLDNLISSLKITKREKIKTLKVAIYDGIQNDVACISNLDDAKLALKQYFPRITALKLQTQEQSRLENDEENLSEEEILETLRNPNDSSNVKLKKLVSRMNSNSVVSILISIIFCIMPVICLGLSWFIKDNAIGVNGGAATAMFFGGTNRALTVVGQQFWRIFTYVFNAQGLGLIPALFQIFFLGFMLLKVTKYTEGIIGSWRFALIIFITYPLVGFFLSVLLPYPTFSGTLILPAMVIASLGVTTWVKKSDTITLFSKNRIIFPLILMLIYALFISGDVYDILLIVMGSGTAAALTLMFTYNYKSVDGYIALPVLMLSAAIIIPVIYLFIPAYGISPDLDTLRALLAYANNKVFSPEYLNKIIHDYNGWNYFIKSAGEGYGVYPFI